MSEHNNDQITQKDLLKLLFDQAQHNATHEEVQAVQEEIKTTNKRFEGLATREELKVEVQQLDSRIEASIDSLRTEMEKRLDKQDIQIAKLDNHFSLIDYQY
ncbi:hypothetical protein [Vibrio sp. Vb339]|uniref:hypothetical protein n=1 Tax=Vibrio sp. Vb339 TaxID=1192013 RepID=UPI0015575C6A|nr:hypothetical protein [Vibrio sp. Vb339]